MALCGWNTRASEWSIKTCQSGVVASSLGCRMVARDIGARRIPERRRSMLVGLAHACSERDFANEHWVLSVSART